VGALDQEDRSCEPTLKNTKGGNCFSKKKANNGKGPNAARVKLRERDWEDEKMKALGKTKRGSSKHGAEGPHLRRRQDVFIILELGRMPITWKKEIKVSQRG